MTYDVNWALGVLAKSGTPSKKRIQQCGDLKRASGDTLTWNECRDLVDQVAALPDADDVLMVDDQGSPVGMISPRLILEEGSRFAFSLAAVCDDAAALVRAQEELLSRVGSDSYGYIAGAALAFMAENILSGAFAVAKAHGTDMQPDMAVFARGETPKTAPITTPITRSMAFVPDPDDPPHIVELHRIVTMPDGADRQAAMEAAMFDTGDLGRVTRGYLLQLDKITEATR
jgi:hypothetical protein